MEQSTDCLSIENNTTVTETLRPSESFSEEVTNTSQPDLGVNKMNSDIHDEINKKLEELEKFSEVMETDKENDSIVESATSDLSASMLEQSASLTFEIKSSESSFNVTNSEEQAIIEPSNELKQENSSGDLSTPLHISQEEITTTIITEKEVTNSDQSNSEEMLSKDYETNHNIIVSSTKEDELDGVEKEITTCGGDSGAGSSESPVVIADDLEESSKNKDSCFSPNAVTSTTAHCNEEIVESIEIEDEGKIIELSVENDNVIEVIEDNEDSGSADAGAGTNMKNVMEEIVITEVDPDEVDNIEEVSGTYAVVEEVDFDVGKKTRIPQDESSQGASTVSEAEENEEVYLVEEYTSEAKDEQIQSDHELFVVTREDTAETDSDPLQGKKGKSIEKKSSEGAKSEEKPKKTEEKPKKPRGRKPTGSIPSHVIGVDLKNPAADSTINGNSRLPKPRLGVKVPYRNLASQMITKKEIQEEVMEVFRQKQAQEEIEKNDVAFTRKLTQRLASKIIPEYPSKVDVSSTGNSSPATPLKVPSKSGSTSSRIEKDADLLAILEGDDDPDDAPQISEEERKKIEEHEKKQRDREIALKQLQELPALPSRSQIKQEVKQKTEVSKPAPSPQKNKGKSETVKSDKKIDIDMVPKIKPGMIIKTYTRKRKSSELEFPIQKKSTVSTDDSENNSSESSDMTSPQRSTASIDLKTEVPRDAYITKSSRVIKKKVIWDPDEVPSPRTLHKVTKSSDSVKSVDSPKVIKVSRLTEGVKSTEKKSTAIEKSIEKKVDKTPETKKVVMVEKKAAGEKKACVEKRGLVKKVLTSKKGKRLSEVDKLLMDEGAINMLYEVKNNDETGPKKKLKTHISLDRAEKELRSRATELLKDLQQNTLEESQKSLRKKDSPPVMKREVVGLATVERKKSKDSIRSSNHSPPASPGFPYEASRIIRRHSSSSFSSGDEASNNEKGSERGAKRKLSHPAESGKSKKMKKSVDETQGTSSDKVEKSAAPSVSSTSTNTSTKTKETVKESSEGLKTPPAKAFTIKRIDKLYMFDLNYKDGPYFTPQLLKDLTASLNRLAKDNNCHVVVFTSTRKSFCLGLNYTLLIADSEEVRKKKATEMSVCVREFLKCLLKFPKVLVAGIQGECSGFGVTMLSLFDMVIASDKAEFSMPYGTLGIPPEAAFLLTTPHISSHGLASELFYTCTKLNASEVSRHGLVTRLCWPEKYKDELRAICLNISQQSRDTIESTKRQLRESLFSITETALSSQPKMLIEHWVKPDSQRKFSSYTLEVD